MVWTSDVVLTRAVWEQVGSPACDHLYIELEYDPISGGPTGNLGCLDCGGVWGWFDPASYGTPQPPSDTNA